jgi:NAD(P)H-dependent flavin oxidoreductase YrpB (nitropropane dioxygenase family)
MIINRNPLLDALGIDLPIIQAPMAGVSTPAMAAAVTKAGGLGSLGVGATDAEGARTMITAVRKMTTGPLNVNLFCHEPGPMLPPAMFRSIQWLMTWGKRFTRRVNRRACSGSGRNGWAKVRRFRGQCLRLSLWQHWQQNLNGREGKHGRGSEPSTPPDPMESAAYGRSAIA